MTKSFSLLSWNSTDHNLLRDWNKRAQRQWISVGLKGGLKGSRGGWKCARFAHKQHKATHSLSLTVIFQHTLMKKDELSCQGSPSWSTNTPMTPCCASCSVAWPREECSHIWIQTQTSKHEKVLAGYLKSFRRWINLRPFQQKLVQWLFAQMP